MSLFTPSLETIAKQKQTRVRGLDAELQKLITGRDTADEGIAAIEAEREAAMAAPGDAPPDLGAFDARLRKPQTDRAWYEQRIPAAEAAVKEARAELREAERALGDERFRAGVVDWFLKEEAAIEAGEHATALAWNHHPDLRPAVRTREALDNVKAVYNLWAHRPAPQKPEDHKERVVRFVRSWGKWSGAPEGGDEACMATEAEALDAVTAGAAVYVFDTEETRALVARAQEERTRRRKYPRFVEDFPTQS